MAELAVKLRGGEQVVSVITRASVEGLGLKEDDTVRMVGKATSVMAAKWSPPAHTKPAGG